MKRLLIFSLFFFILLAGCIKPPPKPVGVGVIITSFSPELTEIEAETDIILSLLVKNTGGAIAKNVNASLIGLTHEWYIDGVTPPTDTQRVKKVADLLYPADPERGMPEGQEGYQEWRIRGPKKGVTQTYDMSVRVYYDYNSTSNTLIRIASLGYFRGLTKEEQKAFERGIISSVTSAGPLVITARAPQPLVTDKPEIPVQFEVQNVGGGRTFAEYIGLYPNPDTLDNVTVYFTVTGVESLKCADKAATIKDATGEGSTSIRLIQGKSGRIFCTFKPKESITTYSDFSFKLEFAYKYFVETASSITVLKAFG